uniref:RNA binding motif protein 39b n=1 Tax=Nothobranchius furzeri TaxID=105023 RepID=A0A8C6LBD0_NOTFU
MADDLDIEAMLEAPYRKVRHLSCVPPVYRRRAEERFLL